MDPSNSLHTEDVNKYLTWRQNDFVNGDGIIAASDLHMEWMLPWWLYNLRKHSQLPITFVDYGLSTHGLKWCHEHGEVQTLNVPNHFFKKREAMTVFNTDDSELQINIRQLIRKNWFKKPFALVLSPYKRTLWLDIDCEVRGDLSPLFSLAENPLGTALTPLTEESIKIKIKQKLLKPSEKSYNAGVQPYLRDAKIIKEWAYEIVLVEGNFNGAEDALASIINQEHLYVVPIPHQYNWIVKRLGYNEKAMILHWLGNSKKQVLNQIKNDPKILILYQNTGLQLPY